MALAPCLLPRIDAPLVGGPPPCARFDHASITVARRGTAPDVARRLDTSALGWKPTYHQRIANASPTHRQLWGRALGGPIKLGIETGEGDRPRQAPGGGRAACDVPIGALQAAVW